MAHLPVREWHGAAAAVGRQRRDDDVEIKRGRGFQ
jgi:hypothetical protein